MRNLARLYMPKIPSQQREALLGAAISFVLTQVKPERIFAFGSVLTDSFDAASDIDLVLVFATQQEADRARRKLYGAKQPELGHPLEMLCVDSATFDRKSDIGGVYAVAKSEGREISIAQPQNT